MKTIEVSDEDYEYIDGLVKTSCYTDLREDAKIYYTHSQILYQIIRFSRKNQCW